MSNVSFIRYNLQNEAYYTDWNCQIIHKHLSQFTENTVKYLNFMPKYLIILPEVKKW